MHFIIAFCVTLDSRRVMRKPIAELVGEVVNPARNNHQCHVWNNFTRIALDESHITERRGCETPLNRVGHGRRYNCGREFVQFELMGQLLESVI